MASQNSRNDNFPGKRKQTVINSWISGSISSAFTTTIYQPLDLLKTQIQLERQQCDQSLRRRFIGRATQSAKNLVQNHGYSYLWRGTGASLLRSVPGVGLYYASLNVLQSNLSSHSYKPDDPTQAFYFGLTARSFVSFLMLPVTVVKVRYESGRYIYPKLSTAVIEAYRGKGHGWTGIGPTILRDSLFSGIYLMCFTKLKATSFLMDSEFTNASCDQQSGDMHILTFSYGVVSGLFASIVTNPIDVVKTNIQVEHSRNRSIRDAVNQLKGEKGGYLRFFDGLVPRSLRRTLIAASTWTMYEFLMNTMR